MIGCKYLGACTELLQHTARVLLQNLFILFYMCGWLYGTLVSAHVVGQLFVSKVAVHQQAQQELEQSVVSPTINQE